MRSDEVNSLSKNSILNHLNVAINKGRIVAGQPSGCPSIGAERFNEDIKFLLLEEGCSIYSDAAQRALIEDFVGSELKVRRAIHKGDVSTTFNFEVVSEKYGHATILIPIHLPDNEDTAEPSVKFGSNKLPSFIKIFNKELGAISVQLDPDYDDDFILELDSGSFYQNSDELASDHDFISKELTDLVLGVFQDPEMMMKLHLAAGNANIALSMLAHWEPDHIDEQLIQRAVEGVLFDNKDFMFRSDEYLPGGSDDLEAAGFTGLLNYIDEAKIYQGALSLANGRFVYQGEQPLVNGRFGGNQTDLLGIVRLLCNGSDRERISEFSDALELAYEGRLSDDVRSYLNRALLNEAETNERKRSRPKRSL